MSTMTDTRDRLQSISDAPYGEMDSLDALDLCLAVEKEFGIQIPDAELEKLTSEDALVELIDGLRDKV